MAQRAGDVVHALDESLNEKACPDVFPAVMASTEQRWQHDGKQTICPADWQPVDICAECKIEFTAVPACTGAATYRKAAHTPHNNDTLPRKCDSGQSFHQEVMAINLTSSLN